MDFINYLPIKISMMELENKTGVSADDLCEYAENPRYLDDLKQYVDNYFKANTFDSVGNNLLVYASRVYNFEAVEFLLDKGGNPNICGNSDFCGSALAYALRSLVWDGEDNKNICVEDAIDTIDLLLHKNAKVIVRDGGVIWPFQNLFLRNEKYFDDFLQSVIEEKDISYTAKKYSSDSDGCIVENPKLEIATQDFAVEEFFKYFVTDQKFSPNPMTLYELQAYNYKIFDRILTLMKNPEKSLGKLRKFELNEIDSLFTQCVCIDTINKEYKNRENKFPEYLIDLDKFKGQKLSEERIYESITDYEKQLKDALYLNVVLYSRKTSIDKDDKTIDLPNLALINDDRYKKLLGIEYVGKEDDKESISKK